MTPAARLKRSHAALMAFLLTHWNRPDSAHAQRASSIVAARGRAAQGERQQQTETGHRKHHEQQDHQFHHPSPPLTEGCLSIENAASSPLRASTSRINASISSDTMPAPAS